MRSFGLLLMLAGCGTRAASAPDASWVDAAVDASQVDTGRLDAAPEEDAGGMRAIGSYLALGSSSTAGAGASTSSASYVGLLSARLRARNAGLVVTNLGAGGARVAGMVAQLPRIRAARPELVTVLPLTDWVSTSTTALRAGYAELLDGLGELGATVYFGDLRIDARLVCGVGSGPGGCYGDADRQRLASKSAVLAELAASRPFVVVVPVFDQNVAHPEYNASDGHPNDRGHAFLAGVFWDAIEPRL